MKFIPFVFVVAVSIATTIPPTMIDAGTLTQHSGSIIITPLASSATKTVTYNTAFTDSPTFALLLSGLGASIDSVFSLGYSITYDSVSLAGA